MSIKLADAFIEIALDYAKAEKEAQNMDKRIMGLTQGTVTKLSTAMVGAGAAITGTFGVSAKAAAEFGENLANVSTLGVKNLGALDDGTRDLAVKFGIDLNDAMKATYETISAGIPEDAAIMVMEQAARGAQAGVGSLGDALDLGTSVMNAWNIKGKDAAGTAAEMEKIMGMAATAAFKGKTTFAEMATSIGQVAPVMSAAGVGTDEFFAAVSALTATGKPTSSAMLQLQAAVSNVIKPSEQASKLAAQLGLDFNAEALAAQGLSGFLDSVKAATGGNVEQMGILFGSVEALGAAISLTGNQAGIFKESLEEMSNAQKNLKEMADSFIANNPALALKVAKAALQELFIMVGRTVIPALAQLAKAATPVMTFISDFITNHPTLSVALGTIAGGIGILSLALGTLGFAVAGIMPMLGLATGAAGLGGVGTAATGAGAAAATAAGAGGIGALVVSIGGFLIVAGMVAAIVGASGFAIYKFGQTAIDTVKAFNALQESTKKTNAAFEEFEDSLENRGVALDRAALKEMNHAQRSAALTEAQINHKEQAMAREIYALTGVDATRDQINRAEMARVGLGVSTQEAAAMAVKGITQDEIRSRMTAAAQTEQAEAAKRAAMAATVDTQAAGLAETINAMARHSEMEQVGTSEISEFKRLMLSGDLEAANAYWMNLRTSTADGLGSSFEQYRQFRIAVQAEMAVLRESVAYATNPAQTGSPSLNMEIASGFDTTRQIFGANLMAILADVQTFRNVAAQQIAGLGATLVGSPTAQPGLAASPPSGQTPLNGSGTGQAGSISTPISISNSITISGSATPDQVKRIGQAFTQGQMEQLKRNLGRDSQTRARARGVRSPGFGRLNMIAG